MLSMKRYTINLTCGAELSVIAQGCAAALDIATAAGWMPWDILTIEERPRCGG